MTLCFLRYESAETWGNSESSTSSTTSSSGGIGWDWGNIFNSTDLESISGKSSNSGLGTWSWGLGFGSTSSSKFDMNGVDSNILKKFANILSSKHCSVRGGFFSISLNLHSTGDSAVGFSTGEIGDVNESVVESGEEMNNTEVVDFSSGTGLWWTEIGLFLFLDFDFLLWWHDE